MGWRSWHLYGATGDQKLFEGIMDGMVTVLAAMHDLKADKTRRRPEGHLAGRLVVPRQAADARARRSGLCQ